MTYCISSRASATPTRKGKPVYSNRDEFNWCAFVVLVIATFGAFLIPAILVPRLIRSRKEEKAG
jgi:hypothetical protein